MGVYGFGSYTPATAGGVAIMPETQIGSTGSVPSNVLGTLPLHHANPLFWLLILVLVLTGYVYGAFDVGVKHLIEGKIKVG